MNYFEDLSTKAVSTHLFQAGPHKFWYLDIMINRIRIRGNTHTRDKRNAVQRSMELIRKRVECRREKAFKRRITLSALRDRLVEDYRVNKSKSVARHCAQAFGRLINIVGDIDIAEMTEEKADDFRMSLSKEQVDPRTNELRRLMPQTINNNISVIRAAFSFAVRQKWISSNPFSSIQKVQVEERTPNVYLPPTMWKIKTDAEVVREDFGKVIEIYLYTAMRLKEGVKLKIENIDFDNRVIHLPAAITKKKRDRVIPLNSRALAILKYLCAKYGKPIPFSHWQIDRFFCAVRERIGFEGRFHDIRKTTNSWLKFYAHLDDSICEQILGHVNRRNTNSFFYTGFIPQPVYQALEMLATVLYDAGSSFATGTTLELDSPSEQTFSDVPASVRPRTTHVNISEAQS